MAYQPSWPKQSMSKDSSDTIKPIAEEGYLCVINLKVNIIAKLDFKFAYYETEFL